MTVSETKKRWITLPEAAMRIGRSKKTFRKWIDDGVLPAGIAHRPVPGGHYIIDVDALDAWVENGCFTKAPGDAA